MFDQHHLELGSGVYVDHLVAAAVGIPVQVAVSAAALAGGFLGCAHRGEVVLVVHLLVFVLVWAGQAFEFIKKAHKAVSLQSLRVDIGGRGPNSAEPTRMQVEPAATAS